MVKGLRIARAPVSACTSIGWRPVLPRRALPADMVASAGVNQENRQMSDVRPALCRICGSYCPILVTVENGRPVKVTGDPDAPLYDGYTCPKGRALPEQHTGPARLLHSMKRQADASFQPIGSEQAMDEIADRVSRIIAEHGPRSVALYWGTGMCTLAENVGIAAAWMEAIGSPMFFGASAIDKPGAPIAQAAHGHWLAGHPPFEAADAWVMIGLNPLISCSGGFPPNNPGLRLKEAVGDRGMKLIVIDPRRTETARRAHLHLQIRPGEDPAVLAAMIHVILAENLQDSAFLAENAIGLEALQAAVAPFTPGHAAERAGVDAEDIATAARIFAKSRYGGIGVGVGPSFSLTGSLTDYLSAALTTLCGFWSRAGDVVVKPNILLPAYEARAEAVSPFQGWDFGERLRSRDLGNSVAGMPTGAIADEILYEGEGRIRALFCMAGNPMMAWPDQQRAARALQSLDLLVTAELEMSATARMSDYVIAPKLSLEVPATSGLVEAMKHMGHLRGIEGPYGRYAPAVVDPPPGSDVIADWELYYGLAQRMGLKLTLTTTFGLGPHAFAPPQRDPLDMVRKPTTDELLELTHRNARIPFKQVKRFPHGHMFEEVCEVVKPRRKEATGKLDVGNGYMMELLGNIERSVPDRTSAEFPYLMISRRSNRLMNSSGHNNPRQGGLEPTNPAYMNPDDLAKLGLVQGDEILMRSRFGEVRAIAAADTGLRAGCISISPGFGANPDEPEDAAGIGCNTGRLLSADAEFDGISGIPRIGGVPVAIERVAATGH